MTEVMYAIQLVIRESETINKGTSAVSLVTRIHEDNKGNPLLFFSRPDAEEWVEDHVKDLSEYMEIKGVIIVPFIEV